MNPTQRGIVIGVGVLAVLGGIVYFGYNQAADEVLVPDLPVGPSTARAGSEQPPRPAMPSSFSEPTTLPALQMAERVQPATATLPSATESWEDAVRKITVKQERARGHRQISRVTYAKIQRLIEESDLTGSARNRLEQLLRNKEMVDFDVNTTAREHGLSPKDPQIEALRQYERVAIDNEIRSLVGNDYFNRIEAGLSHMEDRLYAIEFIGELYQRGMPITAEQRAAVNHVLTDLDTGDAQRWTKSTLDPASGLRAYDTSVLREIAGSLTPEQLEVVRQVRIETNLYRAYRDYRRSKSKAKSPGP